MKHLFFILVLTVGGYAVWQVLDAKERRSASRQITRHGLRLVALVVVLLLLVAAAVFLPGTKLL